jgi:hypothetical protein
MSTNEGRMAWNTSAERAGGAVAEAMAAANVSFTCSSVSGKGGG